MSKEIGYLLFETLSFLVEILLVLRALKNAAVLLASLATCPADLSWVPKKPTSSNL